MKTVSTSFSGLIQGALFAALVATHSVFLFARGATDEQRLGEKLLIGILEDVPGVYAGESHRAKIRVLFVRSQNDDTSGSHSSAVSKAKSAENSGARSGWQAFPADCYDQECAAQYPKKVSWFVGLDGRQIGTVVGQTPESFRYYAGVGLQDIVSGTPPVVGDRTSEFGSFAAEKLRRPLVVASRPNFKDPGGWTRIGATAEIRTQALRAFRSKMGRLCKEGPSEKIPYVAYQYSTNDINVRSHRSSSGAVILTVALDRGVHCNGGGAGDGSVDSQTFGFNAAGVSRFLGSGLLLVDAGDYDGDGKSELLFTISRYNRGGYVLFSDTFAKLAQFEFSYH
ncbi:MAG: hypothetical protein ACK5O6_01650 [Betaproteobacteria bacterium]|nr:hypothetical protein [Rhodocyclaceae bacterium]